jgi:hypothetical protein
LAGLLGDRLAARHAAADGLTAVMKDQSFCPKCGRMYCEGYWGEGVCISDMGFCGEPTADFDEAGRCLRAWYESHRESWWDRLWFNRRWRFSADEFMLGMLNEVHRINCEREDQTKRRTHEPG